MARGTTSESRWFVEYIAAAKRTGRPYPENDKVDYFVSEAWLYRVKWAGFDEAENTWEPVQSLRTCQDLISSFWDHVGDSTFRTTLEGFEISASPEWISREQDRFWRETTKKEVRRQNKNPQRKQSRSPPKKKVKFGPDVKIRPISPISYIDSPAQHRGTAQPNVYAADDDANQSASELTIDFPPRSPRSEETESENPTLESLTERSETPVPDGEAQLLPETPEEPRPYGIRFYEPKEIKSASNLATKQRLATRQIAPDVPRYVSPCPRRHPDPLADDTTDSNRNPTLIPESDVAAAPPNGIEGIADMFESAALDSGESGGMYAPGEDPFASIRNEIIMDESHEVRISHDSGADCDETANEFLNDVDMPHSPERPLFGYDLSHLLGSPATKPWTWTGRLTATPSGYTAPQLLSNNATVIDSTQPAEDGHPTMEAFILPAQDLNLCRLYDAQDLIVAVPAFRPAQQFARLITQDMEEKSFKIFVEYLSRKEQAALLPAIQNGEVVGYIFIVSPAATKLLAALGVPSDFDHLSGPGLVMSLLFLATGLPDSRAQCAEALRKPSTLRCKERTWLRKYSSIQRSKRVEPAYYFALRVTGLPEHAVSYARNHPFVVWAGPAATQDSDTAYLKRALSHSRAGIIDATCAGSKAGIVFIHVRALSTVYLLPGIVELRSRPEVRFYLYGTHPSVPPQRWGHRAIFLLGGVVTFTAAALAGDPWGVLCTIRHIAAHPLWECYLLPQVLGLAVRLNQMREDVDMEDVGESGLPLALDRILDAVLAGQVALLCAPPGGGIRRAGDAAAGYVLEYLLPIFRENKETLLRRCEESSAIAFPDSPGSFETAARAREEVRADMRRMQTQPLLVDAYRRFVAIDTKTNGEEYSQQDGIEWQEIGYFSFNDDFLDAAKAVGARVPMDDD